MSIELTLIQISSAYLRYLPFSGEINSKERSELIKWILLWSLFALAINFWIFDGGISYRAFKTALAAGWLPYFLISLLIIRDKLPQHVFILGMQMLWSFMLHSFAGMVVALIYGAMAEEFLPLQAGLYLIMFALLLKIERKFFKNLLPTAKFFEDKALKWCISILPLAIFLGTTITIAEVTFLPTWKERFSRIFLPIFFLLIYRSMSLMTKQVEKKQLEEQQIRELNRQMETLHTNNALMEKNRLETAELQRNLQEIYRKTDELIADGKISEAKELIGRQTKLLNATRLKVFCQEPLINAALSMYFRRAEEFGIKITYKIDLAEKILTDDSDLAVLLSNLLENAITASKKQKSPSRREISLIFRHKGGQNVLEITNLCDYAVKIGENGLPYTTEIGHGLGMNSLELFAKKYDAFVDFSQENKTVRLNLYWNDCLEDRCENSSEVFDDFPARYMGGG